MRTFQCEAGLLKGPTHRCPDKACVFCDHYTDIFWDYHGGVCMIFCDKNNDTSNGNNDESCPDFIETKEGD